MATSAEPTRRVTIQSLLLHFLDSASTQYAPGPDHANSNSSSTNTNSNISNNVGYPSSSNHMGGGGGGASYNHNGSSAATTSASASAPAPAPVPATGTAPIQAHAHAHSHAPVPIPIPAMRLPLANTTNTNMNRSVSVAVNGVVQTTTPIPLPENVSIAPKKRKSDSSDPTSIPKPKRSRPDPTKPDPLDVSGVSLPGEPTHSVRVYDTCDTVRHKIHAVLCRDGVTQASFLRAIAATYADGRKIQNKQLNDFLAKRGPLAGNRSCIFYASYVFFEKVRIRDGREKDKDRVQMEKQWPQGVDTVHDCSYTLSTADAVHQDKYGAVHDVYYKPRR